MIFFTSDQHFWHANIIRHCNRPYTSVIDMNEALIANWNSVVRPDDYVFTLGDFAFCGVERMREITARLNGHKYLILGNHDGSEAKMTRAGFTVLGSQSSVYFAGRKFNLSHFPYAMSPWERRWAQFKGWLRDRPFQPSRHEASFPPNDGRWLLCGHVHAAWKIKGRQINVGVDQWDYRPISLREIIGIIREREGLCAD